MRRLVLICLVACTVARAQDPAYALLTKAYAALNASDYDTAIAYFNQALPLDRNRTDIREDLGYTYIKAGNDLAAMNLFEAVMRLDPSNAQAALQYAFLAYEQSDNDHVARSRNVFDAVRKQASDPILKATAETAFQNVDGALAYDIAFYTEAIQLDPTNYVAHQQLANYAEQRSDLTLAAAEFKVALQTQFPSLYLDYARVLGKLGDLAGQMQALQAVVDSGDPYTGEQAREQLSALN